MLGRRVETIHPIKVCSGLRFFKRKPNHLPIKSALFEDLLVYPECIGKYIPIGPLSSINLRIRNSLYIGDYGILEMLAS